MITDRSDTAVWIGRYQPLHVGHIAVLKRAIDQISVLQIIGLVCYEQNVTLTNSEPKHDRDANPFSPWERRTLARLSLDGAGLHPNVDIVFVPYLEPKNWQRVEAYLPPRPVFCTTDKDRADVDRLQRFAQLGRRSALVHVGDLKLVSGTDLRRAIRARQPWQPYIQEAAHDFFASIDGPQRLAI